MQLETAQKDKELIWHPFTQASDYEKELLPVITRAKGLKLFDSKGNFYYDTLSSWWTNSLGHCHPLLVKAAQKQLSLLDHVIFAGFTHKPAVDLCTKLSKILPSHLSRFFFSDNGSTSIEVALKIAFQYWKNINKPKSKFAYFTHAYHGDTLGAMSVGGINLYHSLFAGMGFQGISLPAPDCSVCKYRKSEFTYDGENLECQLQCFSEVESLLLKNKKLSYKYHSYYPLLLHHK